MCSRNRRRSLTAEALFSSRAGVAALSAGTAVDAETQISEDLIQWADLILVMESVHRRRLQSRFGPLLQEKRVAVLGIADKYAFMDQKLVQILEVKVAAYVRDFGNGAAHQ